MHKAKYRYNKKAGALQDNYVHVDAVDTVDVAEASIPFNVSMSNIGAQSVTPVAFSSMPQEMTQSVYLDEKAGSVDEQELSSSGFLDPSRRRSVSPTMLGARTLGDLVDAGLDITPDMHRKQGMFFYTVEEGKQVLVIEKSGKMEVVRGPRRVWRFGRTVCHMKHHVAHPGEFLIVRYRDGRQEHLIGPVHVWFDPREHLDISREESLPIAAKEAVVVYSDEEGEVSRRLVHGPATFVPRPGEWLHTFSWHGASGDGYRKVPNALVFQKLWLMPDQMYLDVTDVRTSDDAVLTIRLMMFFELLDIEKMLATTHDPLGDFINAATSDIIEFISRHDFESFKQNTKKLNERSTYKQLVARAEQCGYTVDKVVYRGYGAPARLQQMHDQAIESRTKLGLERATEQQAQELEDFKLARQMVRQGTMRKDEGEHIEHELTLKKKRREEELEAERVNREFLRQQQLADAEQARLFEEQAELRRLAYIERLSELNVDLTSYLTQERADRIVEVRGGASIPHIHMGEE